MTIQTEDIVKREFSRAFLGYDIREVDAFLDELIERIEQLEAQRKQTLNAMENLLKRLADTDGLPDDVARVAANGDKLMRKLIGGEAESTDGAAARARKGDKAARRIEPPDKRIDEVKKPSDGAKKRTDAAKKRTDATTMAKKRTDPAEGRTDSSAAARAAVRAGRTKWETPAVASVQEVLGETAVDEGSEPLFSKLKETVPAPEPDAQSEAALQMPIVQAEPVSVDALIPELLSDLELALADGAIRRASAVSKDAPVRAADEERIP